MKKSNEFNKFSPKSIEDYAEKLTTKSLSEVIDLSHLKRNKKNKGKLGQLIEKYYFGYDLNSDKEADFKEAGVELKVTGVRKIIPRKKSKFLIKQKGLSVKERLVLSIINYDEIANETWESNTIFDKINKLLLMFYLYEKEVPVIERKFILSSLWEPSEKDLKIIKEDWKKIVNKIKNGEAHNLSEGDTMYLGACTKGKSSKSLRTQPFSTIMAKQRAFSYKRSYVDTIFEELYSNKKAKITLTKNTEETIEESLNNLFKPFLNETAYEIEEKLGVSLENKSKQYYNRLSSFILGSDSEDEIDEFKKAGVKIKTIRLDGSGKPTEDMSFPAFQFKEIVHEDWDDSTLKKRLENSKYFFVVFKMIDISNTNFKKLSNEEKKKHIRLEKILLWNMPMQDIETYAKDVWIKTKYILKENNLKVTKKGNRRYTNFPNSKYNDVLFVRTHARDTADTYPLPFGGEYTKHSFWLYRNYLMEQIKKNELL